MQILKNPIEFANDLFNHFGPTYTVAEIIEQAQKAYRLPNEYMRDVAISLATKMN